MKVYEAIFDETKTDGVYAVSLVENPAMEDYWITLSEQKIELSAIDEEKRLLLGAALIPNKKIYRNIDGNEFYITFSENTIEKLAHSFLKKGFQNNSSLEHEIKLEGMSVVEAWTVQDPDKDKSNTFGKRYDKGTWVTMMKVDNDEVWEKAKNGEIKGFSIDALLGLKPLELKQIDNNNMTKQDFIDAFKAIFTSEPQEVKEVETVAEVVEAKPEETTEPVKEFDQEAFVSALSEVFKTELSKINEKVEALEVKLTKEVEEKEKEVKTLKAELSKQPETEGIKANPEKAAPSVVRYGNKNANTQMDKVLEMLFGQN